MQQGGQREKEKDKEKKQAGDETIKGAQAHRRRGGDGGIRVKLRKALGFINSGGRLGSLRQAVWRLRVGTGLPPGPQALIGLRRRPDAQWDGFASPNSGAGESRLFALPHIERHLFPLTPMRSRLAS